MKTLLVIVLVLLAFNYSLRFLSLNNPVRMAIDNFKYYVKYRVAQFYGYRPSLHQPDIMTSIWFLGFCLKLNPWPVQVHVDHTGVYVTRRNWHGLKVHRYFYPMHMVRFITITEVMGYFAQIRIAVRMEYKIVTIQIDRYFRFDQAEKFFKQWQAHAQLN